MVSLFQIITFLSQPATTIQSQTDTFCLAPRGNIAISEKQNNNDPDGESAGMSSNITNGTELEAQ